MILLVIEPSSLMMDTIHSLITDDRQQMVGDGASNKAAGGS